MDMQNPEAVPHLSKIRETTLAEIMEAASYRQKEDRDAFLALLLASPRHPEQVVDLQAVRQDRKHAGFLKDVIAAIAAIEADGGSPAGR
jgi:hypothetical protein